MIAHRWAFGRVLRRRRFLTVLIVALLGAAIGGVAAMTAVAETLLIHPLPVDRRDRDLIVGLGGLAYHPTAGVDVRWWKQAPALDKLAMIQIGEGSIDGPGGRVWVTAALVSREFFEVFNVTLLAGRDFAHPARSVGTGPPMIIGYRLWQAYFHGQMIIGNAVALNGVSYEIVGVAPEGFEFPGGVEVWVRPNAIAGDALVVNQSDASPRWLGRLKAGRTETELTEQLRQLLSRLTTKVTPKSGVQYGEFVVAYQLSEQMAAAARPQLLLLGFAAILVLVTSSSTCALFLLARAMERRQEFATMLALGATTSRIRRYVLAETSLLVGVAGLLGLGIAFAFLDTVRAAAVQQGVYLPAREIAPPVVLAATLATTLLASIIPTAVILTQLRLSELWGSVGGRARLAASRSWLSTRVSLVAVQIALSLLLTLGATIAARALVDLSSVDFGFDPRRIVTAYVGLSGVPDGGQYWPMSQSRSDHSEILRYTECRV